PDTSGCRRARAPTRRPRPRAAWDRLARVRPALPRPRRHPRRGGPGPSRDRTLRADSSARSSRSARHRRHRRGHRRRDRPPRRPGGAARRLRPGSTACRGGLLAAGDQRLPGLAARRRDRAGAVAARPADRRVLDLQPPAARRRCPRLSLRAGSARANRGLAPAPTVRAAAGLGARSDHPLRPARPLARGGLRRAALGRARRGAAPWRRGALGAPRRPARRDRDRDSADDALPATRAPESAPRGIPRARACAEDVARRLSARRWGDRDRAPPLPPALLPPDTAALPRLLPGDDPLRARVSRAVGG